MDYVFQCTFQIVGLVSTISNINVEFTTQDYSKQLWKHAILKKNHNKLKFSFFMKPLNLTLVQHVIEI
jgi:hypothetical protein